MTKKRLNIPARAVPGLGADGGTAYVTEALRTAGTRGPNTALRTKWVHQGVVLVHPQVNGANDPLTVTLVLDCLLRLNHTETFYARSLVNLLKVFYPQILWDAHTVGKILYYLVELAREAPLAIPPVQSLRDFQGHFYWIAEGDQTWHWLMDIREAMGTEAERILKEELTFGKPTKRAEFPHEIITKIWTEAA